ncbi:elongation factor P 5-aminopentanone reductase [Candidatus Clostridium radicumherbarum]|uniref:Elongation factor P 5-aminopentanone reductase n=1 Tax=Candidatus Clostridium radicumherbarum TaxID=3381662 RepID=A0ABW8TPA8_9CLOT
MLKSKVALITGGSRGIGRSIAIELVKAGAAVVISFSKNEAEAEETLKLIKEIGGFGKSVKGDVSIYKDAAYMIDFTIKSFGSIDILINNAGISHVGLFMDMQESEWNKLFDVDLKGVINCSHYALQHMVRQERGNIINISSIWGSSGASCEAIYSAAKGAVNSFTKALAKEMAPSKIRVNAIAPGVINTEMNNWLTMEERKDLTREIPMQRFGSPEDIGKLAVFLASDDANYITGQIITVDGGFI